MFEDIVKKTQLEIYTNATILADGNLYKVKVYNMKMTAGTVVGFIKDNTRKMDGYVNYKISIPIKELSCEWSFSVMVVRMDSETLKFQTTED
jgi:hypothetical protein